MPADISNIYWLANCVGGLFIQASSSMFPSTFGRAPRNFSKHCHEFSGEEWKQQATLFLPIYLNGELPDIHYNALCNLVKVIGMLHVFTCIPPLSYCC